MESIYAWITVPPPAPVKPALYHSTHDGAAMPRTCMAASRTTSHTSSYGSFGRDLTGGVPPAAYLRGGAGARKGDGAHTPSPRIARARVKPAVPRVVATSQASGSPRPAPRDYVTANAVGAITASLRAAPPPAEPNWLARPGYGAAPAYLARNVQLVGARRAEARASCDAAAAAEAARSGRRELSPEERGELLAALKARWEVVSRRYQGITHKRISSSTSTVSEIRAKETAEGELRALEADVARLSVNAPVYLLTA